MISLAVLSRDLTNCIAEMPVTIRHYYTLTLFDTIIAGANSLDDYSMLMSGGLLDEPKLEMVAPLSAFVHGVVAPRDRVDVLLRDAITWFKMECKRVPTFYDPVQIDVRFSLGTWNG